MLLGSIAVADSFGNLESIGGLNDEINYEVNLNNKRPIDVDGYVPRENPTDRELERIKNRLQNQKMTIDLNKQKTKGYKKLVDSTEKLSETSEELYFSRSESEKLLNDYHKRLECLERHNFNYKKCNTTKRQFQRSMDQVDTALKEQADEIDQKTSQKSAGLSKAPTPIVNNINIRPSDYEEGPIKSSYSQMNITPIFRYIFWNIAGQPDVRNSQSFGIRGDYQVSSGFFMGASLDFGQSDIQTLEYNNFNNNFNFNNGPLSFQNLRGGDAQYQNFSIGLFGKYYVRRDQMFRPYIVGGVNFNNTDLEYTRQPQFNQFNNGFGNNFGAQFSDSYSSQNFGFDLGIGSDLHFSKNFGATLEIGFRRNFIRNEAADRNFSPFFSNQESFIDQLGREIDEGNNFNIGLGFNLNF